METRQTNKGLAFWSCNLTQIMKTSLRCLTATGLALLISNSGRAQNQSQWSTQSQPPTPFYVGGDVGAAIEQSVSLKNLNTRANFDVGARGDVYFGYNIVPALAVEFDTGVIWNRLKSDSSVTIGGPFANRGDLYQVPFLGNLIFKAPLPGGVTPYIGAGAGGVLSTLDLSHEDEFDSFQQHTSDSDFTFAYQGLAGIKFAIAWNMEFGVGYKFMGTLDHHWFGDDPNLVVHTGPVLSHSILASFTWKF